MNKPGYYKGELRPCECGGYPIRTIENKVLCECGNQAFYVGSWNYRPSFDKAIDALIELIISIESTDNIYFKQKLQVCSFTGLTWTEALEIYKQRQEDA